jgi:hypothetical protein
MTTHQQLHCGNMYKKTRSSIFWLPIRNQGDRRAGSVVGEFLLAYRRGHPRYCFVTPLAISFSSPKISLRSLIAYPVSASFKKGRAAKAVAKKGAMRVNERILKEWNVQSEYELMKSEDLDHSTIWEISLLYIFFFSHLTEITRGDACSHFLSISL